MKCMRLHQFVIGGWDNDFHSALLGEFVDGELRYVGRVARGLENGALNSIARKLTLRRKSPFKDSIPERDVQFCEPSARITIQFLDLTEDGRLRHASARLIGSDRLKLERSTSVA